MAWQRSSFVPILDSILTSLATSTGLDSSAIKVRAKREWNFKFNADRILIVVPQSMGRDAVVSDGSGRIMTAIQRQVWIQCVNRLALDTADDGYEWFTNDSYGLIPFEEEVLNALTEYSPLTSGVALTIEPIKFMGGVPPTQEIESPGWGQETLAFQVTYAPPLTQSYQ